MVVLTRPAFSFAGGILLAACGIHADTRSGAATGAFETFSYSNAYGTRTYKLYTPAAAGQALPLLVDLHGCSSSADDEARWSRFNELRLVAQRWLVHGMGHMGATDRGSGSPRDTALTDERAPDLSTPTFDFLLSHVQGRTCSRDA